MEALMCLAVPARVIETDGQTAKVELLGNVQSAALALVEDVKEGDYILLHAGFAIQKLEQQDAEETIELFKEMEAVCDE